MRYDNVRLIRVFPRKTRATPRDAGVRFGPPGLFDEADAIHVSATFTDDREKAEWLGRQWESVGAVTVGGPAFGDPGGEFTPGLYVDHGYTITSRGCPNNCWFCLTPKREGGIRELAIQDGHNVLDSNLLACSRKHQSAVFAMLKRQKQRPEFTGGLEAARLTEWHCTQLADLKPKSMWFAYDELADRDPLHAAAKLLSAHGLINKSKRVRCYVLVGYRGDTMDHAARRLEETQGLGFVPMAMLYRSGKAEPSREWREFQRLWARPSISESSQKEV